MENTPINHTPLSDLGDPSAKKKQDQRILIIVIVAGLALACACIGACVAFGGVGVYSIWQTGRNVQPILDDFMTQMSNGDVDAAHAHISPLIRDNVTVGVLREMAAQPEYQGYQEISVTSVHVSATANNDPNELQGTSVTISGLVSYGNGTSRTYQAVLEEEDDTWYIYELNFDVSQEQDEESEDMNA